MAEWRDINDPPPRDHYGLAQDWDGEQVYTTKWVLCSVRGGTGYGIGRAVISHATGKVIRWQSTHDAHGFATQGFATHWCPLPAKPHPVKDKS